MSSQPVVTKKNAEGEDLIDAPESTKEAFNLAFAGTSFSLFGKAYEQGDEQVSMVESLRKIQSREGGESTQGANTGIVEHPFNMAAAVNLRDANEHHSNSLRTKVNSTVGLGWADSLEENLNEETGKIEKTFSESEVDKLLDPACAFSFADLLTAVTEDLYDTGNGYIEVAYSKDNTDDIVGLFHMPACNVNVEVEEDKCNFHYRQFNQDGATSNTSATNNEVKYARFGEKDRLRIAAKIPEGQQINEIIHIRIPTSRSKYYGWPDWLSAVPDIEMAQCQTQFKFDFYNNRGVPEFIFLIMGQKLPKKDWKNIENALRGTIGAGNQRKSMALNLAATDLKVELFKMAMDSSGEDDFVKVRENLAVYIVTAHGVPPLLANILIPGKLGATNELPNAVKAFQYLRVSPVQRIIERTLVRTLSAPNVKVIGSAVKSELFKLLTLIDVLDLEQMDTTSRMKEPLAQAQAEGRNPSDGLIED